LSSMYNIMRRRTLFTLRPLLLSLALAPAIKLVTRGMRGAGREEGCCLLRGQLNRRGRRGASRLAAAA
jgi:hypothetical protein